MSTQEERQAIREKHPDSWIAVTQGDVLIGKVADVTEAWSDQRNKGSYYPLLTIDPEEATGYEDLSAPLKVHCFGTVLFNEVMRHQPEVGERVRIIYRGTGEAKKKGQNPPELYTLTVAGRKDAGARAYGRITRSEQPVPSGAPAQSEVPVSTEDFEQGTLSGDEDLPF